MWNNGKISFLKDCVYLYLDRVKRKRERKGQRSINVWLPLVRPLLRTWPTT